MLLRRLSEAKRRLAGRDRAVRQIFHDFNRTLLLMVEHEGLQASIAARMREIHQAERLIIFQRDASKKAFRPTYSTGLVKSGPDVNELQISSHGRLVKWLQVNETCLVVNENPDILEFLEAEERDLIQNQEIQICVPFTSINRLMGFVMMGAAERQHGVPAGRAELLQLLAGQAALALENAALYAEQRERLRRLHRAERLATAGQLAAGVAHEIRNPLTAIRSTIQYLQQTLPAHASGDDSATTEMMGDLLEEIDRIDQTVNGLLSLARPRSFDPKRINLAEVIEQVAKLVSAQAKKEGVQIEQRLADKDLWVLADRSQLVEVLFNLFVNALESMSEGGRLQVLMERGGEGSLGNSRAAEIRIIDSGPGIPAKNLNSIFDPFFTTKQSGTGLGLAICHGIVQRHQGEIELKNVAPQGACALVKLPLSEA